MHLSIGIISCNRLKYLKGLLKSLECLKSESGIEIIVVDNGSTESGLVEYLNSEKSRGFIDKLILNKERDWKNDEYKAKNIIFLSRFKFFTLKIFSFTVCVHRPSFFKFLFIHL